MHPSAEYTPRKPKETLLYGIVSEHLPGFLALVRESYSRPLPKYVTDTFRGYLECGDLSVGFTRYRCSECSHEVLVGFSCKARGVCPSCNTRRMTEVAASIVDRTLPNVPFRQWVLSLPFLLRAAVALRPEVLSALARIFSEEVRRHLKRSAGLKGAETGTILFVQRFGGSLNLHVHFHMLAVEGVFEKRPEQTDGTRFFEVEGPNRAAVLSVVTRIRDRAVRFLKRRGLLESRVFEDRSTEPEEPSALEATTQIALAKGEYITRPFAAPMQEESLQRREPRFSAELDGFNLHCAVTIASGDDDGRERLLRYCARPAFALDRLEILRDGRIAYRVKTVRKGRTHRVMTAPEFLARLAALIPPPRYPLVRYSGVFSSGSKWRKLVVPKPRGKRGKCDKTEESASKHALAPKSPASSHYPSRSRAESGAELVRSLEEPRAIGTLTVKHWNRLREGELFASSPNIPWAILLKRTFGFDAELCPKCDRKMRMVDVVDDRSKATALLGALGIERIRPSVRRSRDPTGDYRVQSELEFGA